MNNVFDILEERGYIEQLTHPTEIKDLFVICIYYFG